jgi:hypothetical protein
MGVFQSFIDLIGAVLRDEPKFSEMLTRLLETNLTVARPAAVERRAMACPSGYRAYSPQARPRAEISRHK